MIDRTQLKGMIIAAEGSMSHLYLDTAGLVTVGVGHMIPAVPDAQRLTFVVRDGGAAASVDQIAVDFENVIRQPKGFAATHYLQFTLLDMPPAAVAALLDADIAVIETGVRARFTGYDTYPASAQDALLDMAFNLGPAGLANHFPLLKAAAEAGNWAACAAQCHRNGVSDTRNQQTQALFESAAGA